MGVQMKPLMLGAAFAAVSCTTIIALILSLANHQTLDQPYSTQYGIVFDAGSTHTTLFLYQWLGSKENNTGIVSQSQSCDVDGDGISSYVQNPPGAGESLKKCLDFAKSSIPSGKQRATPVYIGATAGMRLLSLQNQSQADIILAEVAKTIRSYPFDFRGARILTGMEEGAYGWITVNYLFESFIKHTFEGKWVHPKAGRILGALDLGGASTQISFSPKDPVRVPESAFNLQLYGYKYEVYTHSYQCYGKDQAMKKLQAWLHKNAGASSVVNHPCYHQGYNFTLTLAEIYNSPCVVTPNNLNSTAKITFLGISNSSLCLSLMEKIVNLTNCTFSPDCGIDGVYQPPVNGEFFAFSAYFYTFNFLGLAPKAPLNLVLSTIDSHCNKTWKTLVAQNPSIKAKYLRDYCASAHYIMTILLKGLKFSNIWDQISFEEKVADTDVGWTLGYMLNLTNLIPSERSRAITGVTHSQWAAQTFFIVCALFLSLLIIIILFLHDPKH
ncbi:ectonucleoside triphosphate diphosphohydrolase 8-like [Xyrauchen texanus]|uniref:ectonucleoside triphosphate diphosphohydrolase 8-like n=1 Tax=Xyrauchen texanus TaxID=154827 RepID=UPI002241C2E7|nr:ectonucleoside triphosphate diphosphohydrolase 8-like [Xyrauchen texanus]XP_051985639.1 ectonucleoside triphosphate diphosphohydrolase 8-like [Xyrauchen texanus]